jgi:hypothetical protein
MNESLPSTPSLSHSSTLPLRSLQEIPHSGIIQKKGEMHDHVIKPITIA